MTNEKFDGERDLWALLGRASRREASPWFADRVLQGIEASEPTIGVFAWLRWALPAVCGVALVILAVVNVGGQETADSRYAVAEPAVEFETISDLDLIVANNESSLWLESIASSSVSF